MEVSESVELLLVFLLVVVGLAALYFIDRASWPCTRSLSTTMGRLLAYSWTMKLRNCSWCLLRHISRSRFVCHECIRVASVEDLTVH